MTRFRLHTDRTAVATATAVLVLLAGVSPAMLHGRDRTDERGAMVQIPAGSYVPLYRPPSDVRPGVIAKDTARSKSAAPPDTRHVDAFEIDVFPVTNGEYLDFVRDHPAWRRSQVKKLFTEASYLSHWKGDLELGPLAPADSPVVNVSWFAARAYLKSHGKELPTVDQWEYVAAASERQRDASRDPVFIDRLREWYGQPVPQPLPPVSTGVRNLYGVRGLHGLVWEWALDFNSALVTGESRGDSAIERTLYCGSGASGTTDFENYPAFMRYALRSSLQARYSVGSLGFRGVRNRTGDTR